MSGNRANLIKCRGLVTFGSELSVSEGSLKQAENVNVDENGVITRRRGFNDYALPTGGTESAGKTVKQIFEYKDSIIRHYNDLLEYEDSAGVFQTITGTYNELRTGYRTKWQEANSNMYFTSDEGIKKISVKTQADLNADMVTNAGGPKAGYASGLIVPTIGGFLPPESQVAYRIVYGTKDNNNNLILGSPSSRFVVTNYSADVSVPENSTITMTPNADGAIVDGDYLVYSTLNNRYTVYFDTTGGSLKIPKTGDTIGTTYVNVDVTGNTTNDNNSAAILANSMASSIPNITITLSASNVVNIVSTEEGDVTDIGASKVFDGTSTPARITTAKVEEGKITSGSSATVKVTGVVPDGITTDYFYQIYRTSNITVQTGLTISDLDPGDEMNLVYEAGLTSDQIIAKEFEYTDTTPESFRASAVPLYTNEVTGEGILQSNDVPPIALDVELFRNYMFYANTKQKHKLEFSMISVDDFISGSTRFVVGNSTISRYYTFVGDAEVTDVTIDAVPDAGNYIELYSANDERRYYIYFGLIANDPKIAGAIGYRIDLTGSPTTSDIADRIESALIDNVDVSIPSYSDYNALTEYVVGDLVNYTGFNYICILDTTGNAPSGTASDNTQWEHISADNVLTISHTNNGYTTGIPQYGTYIGTSIYAVGDNVAFGGFNYQCILVTTGIDDTSEDPTGAATDNTYWTYVPLTIATPSTDGIGEVAATDEGGDVLLSGLISVGQSIDETARSLVKIISKDPLSPVNAYYLSTSADLPGNILLEARSLEDINFYIAIEDNTYDPISVPTDKNLGAEFTPELPISRTIIGYTGTNTTTEIELTNHGYSTGDTKFIGVQEDDYDNTTAYLIGDSISFSGYIYTALVNTTGNAPTGTITDNTEWQYISPEFSGVYTITELSPSDPNKFEIEVATPSTTSGFVPSFSSIFSTDVESDNQELSNRIYYSKTNEPEAVPTSNYIDVGPQDEEIKRILALRDNLFVLKDDGIYVISGTSAPDWSVRLIDSTRIIAPDSAVVLNNQIYCLTEQGITRVVDSGAGIISRGIENLIDNITNQGFDFSSNTFGVAYENDRAYIMFAPSNSTDTSATQAFRYNIFEQTWTTWKYDATCGHVMARDSKLYLGNADRNYVSQERKNNDRTDHADRNFSAAINANGVSETIVELSTLINIKPSDVLVQTQDVTINYINFRLLKKMDTFDTEAAFPAGASVSSADPMVITTPYDHNISDGTIYTIKITVDDGGNITTSVEDRVVTYVTDTSISIPFDNTAGNVTRVDFINYNYYYNTFKVASGDNLSDKMQAINDHLVILDPANITVKAFTLTNIRTLTETLVAELNTVATITSIKTYKLPETVNYEAYIVSVDTLRNQVTLQSERPWIEGSIEVYKGFKDLVEWNPQHFGDPSALKQIRYVTIMFDQNNFYTAIAKFASDAAQAVKEVPFSGKGIGYWGDLPFDDKNAYWGGTGNDIPFRTPVPSGKQRCRYLSLTFEHNNAREGFRIVGISAVVRAISDKAYR